ncbi:PIN domain-containing protein [Mycobacterium shinjukuense]|uniref:Ribonuclease VapC n=1 Tax=Mycobacterium shinjukuense TaxID=398694 RepID=A0A7I7MMX6_9MYCO|nr:TA system VapC family ribonuclease toxin [Mycobacterium shinjukuense]MCV6984867.1 PIN domain-containing protein [Mycobacterium shinjukuense]ORB70416.1 VapC toxin family PIN domain ribonuclease [Mycobacterium shinjukuense]BBX73230.1 ribonuclease VapC37 [Mycobacterium shinjukuense]
MLIDANLLLYAVDQRAVWHHAAVGWLSAQLNGSRRVGLPWQSLAAFLRIGTHPRAFPRPLTPAAAFDIVDSWLSVPVAWAPEPGPEYARILGHLIVAHDVRGNLIPDAMLAALAIEHGLTLYSTDTDFARFSDLRWENPLQR